MERIKKIVLDTLEGRLQSLKDLYRLWPESILENVKFLEEVYDDVENVVEHSIVKEETRMINKHLFQESISYKYLVIDYFVLMSGKSSKEMVELKKELKRNKRLDYKQLQLS